MCVHQTPDRWRDAARPDGWMMMRRSVIGCADTADHDGHRYGPEAVVAGWVTGGFEVVGDDEGGVTAVGAATHPAVATVTTTSRPRISSSAHRRQPIATRQPLRAA